MFSLMVVFLAAMSSCTKEEVVATIDTTSTEINTGSVHLDSIINNTPVEELSNDEINAILQMREEEKLARDVYDVAGSLWTGNIFANISGAESKHMTAVWALIEKYDLQDPITTDVAGQFSSSAIQAAYDAILPDFQASKQSAILKGSYVEEMDIYDLRELKKLVDNTDILLIFDNLERGSRNHLRGFYEQQQILGVTYTPQFITQAEYDQIVNSPREH